MKSAGYSSTPLAKKLGIRNGYKIKLVNAPAHYLDLFTDLPNDIEITNKGKSRNNLVHFFPKDAVDLISGLPLLKKEIFENGIIWVSWLKKSSKVVSDVNENLIRSAALEIGLVDVKVCAIDDVWSGLKLVIPLKERNGIENS